MFLYLETTTCPGRGLCFHHNFQIFQPLPLICIPPICTLGARHPANNSTVRFAYSRICACTLLSFHNPLCCHHFLLFLQPTRQFLVACMQSPTIPLPMQLCSVLQLHMLPPHLKRLDHWGSPSHSELCSNFSSFTLSSPQAPKPL